MVLLRVLGIVYEGAPANGGGRTERSTRLGAVGRSRNRHKLGYQGLKVIRQASGVVGFAKDVVYTKKADLRTSRYPSAQRVTGKGVDVTGERVKLIPVHKGVYEEERL